MAAYPATLAESLQALKSGSTTSEALVQSCLERIALWQPHINAFISIETERALQAARRADAARSSGNSAPLCGVPLAHKDLFSRDRLPLSAGAAIPLVVPPGTAAAVARLEAAGSVTLGSLNLSEFAAYSTGENPHWGDCRNPWDRDRITGGSSSGSAAALAARLVFGSLGTDTGGSGRTSAAMCGIVGLKTTAGLVSLDGAMPRAWSLDTVAVMARTAQDCALLLDAIAEPHQRFEQPAREWKIGVPDLDLLEDIDPPVRHRLHAAAAALDALGALNKRITLPNLDESYALAELIMKCEAAAIHGRMMRERPQDYSAPVFLRNLAGFHIPAVHYIEALAVRAKLTEEFVRAALQNVDALFLPVSPGIAPRFSEVRLGENLELPKSVSRLTRYLRPFNYFGLPALSVPGGFVDGMPVGFQLVGRPFADATLLAIAHAYQQATDWHTKLPREPG